MAKASSGDFKVTTLDNSLLSPLLRIYYYHNKRLQVKEFQYLIPTYNWILTLILNWTCSVVTISPFQCTALSIWLTNSMRGSQYAAYSPTWERCWLQSSSIHYTMKITKLIGHKTLRCTNTVASSRERWTKAYVSDSEYACKKLLHCVASAVTALKTILIYVWGCEKRKPKRILMDWMKNNSEKLRFINLNR